MKIVNSKNDISVNKLFRRYLIVLLLSLAFLFTVVSHTVAQKTDNKPQTHNKPLTCKLTKPETFENATIEFINAEGNGLRIEQCNPDLLNPYPVNFSVESPQLKGVLDGFSSGDLVNIVYTTNKDTTNNVLKSISVVVSRVSVGDRWGTIIFTFLVLVALTWVILWCAKGKFIAIRELFVGEDKRLSNSKSQMAVWFFVLIASYISLTWLRVESGDLRFVGGIGIPQNLLLLSGVSALTYAGAKVITQSQVNSHPGSKPEAPEGKASPADFVTDDRGNTDFGDFQMTVITILAIVVYCVQVFDFLGTIKLYQSVTLPDVDTTILSIFGLSQGAYLTKKAVVATGAQDTLKLGAKGENVKTLKTILNKKINPTPNLDEGDDSFDQQTQNAVKQFQKDEGLEQTGIVDVKTREKLGL